MTIIIFDDFNYNGRHNIVDNFDNVVFLYNISFNL